MKNQFTKHHGASQRHLSVGDRVVVLTRKRKRKQDSILKVLSEVRYIVCLDDKNVERHINHIWKSGTNIPTQCQVEDDMWMYNDLNADPTSEVIVLVTEEPLTLRRARNPDIRVHEEVDATPRRLTWNRAPPKRLAMDPKTKSYSEWWFSWEWRCWESYASACRARHNLRRVRAGQQSASQGIGQDTRLL